ncbi:MAG: hypothetical protein ACI9VR_003029 [Cognaticolwellia sp.]|jgi:hypothetical protein
MPRQILIIGRLQERIDDLVAQLRDEGLSLKGSADFEEALRLLETGDIEAVAIGAGIEDSVRLPFADRLRAQFPSVEVHVKPDRSGGPAAMLPFVRAVAAAT